MKKAVKRTLIGLLILSFSQILMVGCLDDDTPDYAAQEKKILEQYLLDNNITVEPTESGLYFIQGEIGTGPFAELGDSVSIYFAGFTLGGNIIATNIEAVAIEYEVEDYEQIYIGPDPFIFKLGDPGKVVEGIEEGLTYMNEGASATLIIPSDIGIVGSYVTVRYEIELVDLVEPAVK